MKEFSKQKIEFYSVQLAQNNLLLDSSSRLINDVNLGFQRLSDQFLAQSEESEDLIVENVQPHTKFLNISQLRLDDSDINGFLDSLAQNKVFEGNLTLSGHHLTDESSMKLAQIIKQNYPLIKSLDLSDNLKMNHFTGEYLGESLRESQVLECLILQGLKLNTNGVNRIIEGLRDNQKVEEIDLGKITNSSLIKLVQFLNTNHNLKHISFAEEKFIYIVLKYNQKFFTKISQNFTQKCIMLLQFKFEIFTYQDKSYIKQYISIKLQTFTDDSEPWENSTKQSILESFVKNRQVNKQILSFDIKCEDNVEQHLNLIAQISSFCKQNRQQFKQQANHNYQQQQYDRSQPDYFQADNHRSNMLKFSCKSYINNVFNSVLDEGLYILEKERMNKIRDDKVEKVTNQPQPVSFKENILESEGSLVFLARFLHRNLHKIQEFQK